MSYVKRLLGVALVGAALVAGSLATTSPAAVGAAAAPSTGNHFIANLHGSRAPMKLGYTIFDTGSDPEVIRALPAGVRALVWLGQKCPTRANARFKRKVRRLSRMHKVFGYYLSDEPHVADCPRGPAALATRARFVRTVSGNRQKSFVLLSELRDYRAFRPRVTHLSMVGLDPYPCSVAHPDCALSKIGEKVRAARRRGIPLRKIVPVYQAFGQEKLRNGYYNLPTAREMRGILARWAKLVPNPPMDYTYGWGNQGSADPTLVDAPRLQRVFADVFTS